MTMPDTDEILIPAAEIRREVEKAAACRDCVSEPMVHVAPDEDGELDWHVVVAHSVTCPSHNGVI